MRQDIADGIDWMIPQDIINTIEFGVAMNAYNKQKGEQRCR